MKLYMYIWLFLIFIFWLTSCNKNYKPVEEMTREEMIDEITKSDKAFQSLNEAIENK